MDSLQRVLWTDGLFLTPQHFQQQDRHQRHQRRTLLRAMAPLAWGVVDLELDRDALTNGSLRLRRGTAIMPDGSLVDFPATDRPPAPRDLSTVFSDGVDRLSVSLALPFEGEAGVRVAEGGRAEGHRVRWLPDAVGIDDEAGGERREISIARQQLLLIVGDEAREDCATMVIGAVVRSAGGGFAWDEAAVPPALRLGAQSAVANRLGRVVEQMSLRLNDLGELRRTRGEGMAEFTVSEIAGFWMLNAYCTHLPLLRHYRAHPDEHPRDCFLALSAFAGALHTLAESGHPRDLPTYDHQHPAPAFTTLFDRIETLMGTTLAARCQSIALTRQSEVVFTVAVSGEVLQSGRLILALGTASDANKVAKDFAPKAKLASPTRLGVLLAQALSGVRLSYLPVPPQEVPAKADRQYFELQRSGDDWTTVVKEEALSIYVPPEFTEVKLELLIIIDNN